MALPRVQPIRPTWRKEPFDAPDWLFDLKYDGFCGMCYIEPDGCRLLSRNGKTFARFETLARQVATELDVSEAILDGEVITADETGRPPMSPLIQRCRPAGITAQQAPAAAASDLADECCVHYRDGISDGQGVRTLRPDVREQPRRGRRQGPSRPLQLAGALAQDQKPRLFASGRQGRPVQRASATTSSFGKLAVNSYPGSPMDSRQRRCGPGAADRVVQGMRPAGRA